MKKSLLVIIAIAIAVLGSILVASSLGAPKRPGSVQRPALGFYATSSNESPAVGAQFDVKLYANTGTNQVNAISAMINYDAAAVRPDIVASAPNADPLATPAVDGFDETLACGPHNGCRNDTGSIVIALTNTGSSTRSGNDIYIGTIRFTALQRGPANITYNAGVDQTGFLNPDQSVQTVLNTRSIQNVSVNVGQVKGRKN